MATERVLNVAEKNDAAKELSRVLSRGSYRMVCHCTVTFFYVIWNNVLFYISAERRIFQV